MRQKATHQLLIFNKTKGQWQVMIEGSYKDCASRLAAAHTDNPAGQVRIVEIEFHGVPV